MVEIINEALQFETGTIFCIKDCPSFTLLKNSDRSHASRRFTSIMNEGWADETYRGKQAFRTFIRN